MEDFESVFGEDDPVTEGHFFKFLTALTTIDQAGIPISIDSRGFGVEFDPIGLIYKRSDPSAPVDLVGAVLLHYQPSWRDWEPEMAAAKAIQMNPWHFDAVRDAFENNPNLEKLKEFFKPEAIQLGFRLRKVFDEYLNRE